ncbi:MAG: alpha/beta hydrolase, partial [Segetibacter sp.]
MKIFLFISMFVFQAQGITQIKAVEKPNNYPSVEHVRRDFIRLLQRPVTALKPSFTTIKTDSVVIEKGSFYSEATERVPVVIYTPVVAASKSFPVVICLHGTGGSKEDESIKRLLNELTKVGIMGVAIDARYHGERIEGGANKARQYVEA